MGRKKRRKRNGLEPESSGFSHLWSAKEISSRIAQVGNCSRQVDEDISIAAVMALQFWKGVTEGQPDVAFCQLAKSISVIFSQNG